MSLPPSHNNGTRKLHAVPELLLHAHDNSEPRYDDEYYRTNDLAKPFIRAFISVTDSRHDLQSLQLKNSFLETSYGNHPVVLSHTQHR